MPSRADRRRAGELALRAVVIGALAIALWRSLDTGGRTAGRIDATSATLNNSIATALTQPQVRSIQLTLATTPTRVERASLVALRRAGIDVGWTGTVSPVALEVIRDRDPSAGSELRVAAAGIGARVFDSAGVIDTIRASAATLELGTLVGEASVGDSSTTARASLPAASARRAVLVLGRADWESKFVMTALTEAGWQVRARIPSAPGVSVEDPGLAPIDTSRYDAVVALDTTASAFAQAIARFVEQGGGLVAAGGALGLSQFAALAPASASARIPGRILLAEDTLRPRDLPITPLTSVRHDAVTLERQPSGVALVARRAGLGRVLAVGYDESWRWRMLGGTSGPAEHRMWWSRAVASVSPERADSTPSGSDAAPLVALEASLGASHTLGAATMATAGQALPLWLLALALVGLLAEIASRRFRGEK